MTTKTKKAKWTPIRTIIQVLAKKHHLTQEQTTKVVMGLFAELRLYPLHGREVHVPDFGIFCLKTRKARFVRDVKGGEWRELPATTSIGFRAAKASRGLKAVTP